MTYLDHVSIGIVAAEPDLTVRFWNSCMEDWTGLPRERILGNRLQDFYPRFGERNYQARLRLLIEGGAPVILSYQLHGSLFPPLDAAQEARVQHITISLDKELGPSPLLLFSVEDRTEVSMRIRAARTALREKEFLMSELNHRVKNNLNMILSFIELQRSQSDSDALVHGLDDLEGRIRSFAALHEAMYRGSEVEWIPADNYLRTVAGDLFRSMTRPGSAVALDFRVEPMKLDAKSALYTGLIAVEALTNAMKYGIGKRPQGSIILSLRKVGEKNIELSVEDDGPGFPAGFQADAGDSLGTRIISILAEELRGSVRFENAAGGRSGARVVVAFSSGTART